MTTTAPTEAGAASLTVNGTSVPLGDRATPHTTTLDWLRDRGLTGSKEGCAEGECGACAVLVARPAADGSGSDWVALNSCLVPVAALDGQELVTVEGLGEPGRLHPVQRELAERGGSQCGYCTPGFVCAMAAEYYRPGRVEARGEAAAAGGIASGPAGNGRGEGDGSCGPNGFDLHAISGNLCRCTGYRPIRDAAWALGAPDESDPLAERRRSAPAPAARTHLEADGAELVRPADLVEALELLRSRPEAVLLAGATDVGVDVNLKGARPSLLVAVDRLPELRGLDVGGDEIRIGAGLTLTEVERGLAGRVPLLAQLFPRFASPLIRNGATIGGNLGTASPIGDAAPVLLALDASLVLTSAEGERVVPLVDYFTGYRQSVRRPGELIREVRIPLPLAGVSDFHKVAKRRVDDISSVAVAVALDLVDGSVARVRIGLGGVGPTPLRALRTEESLVGRPWTRATVDAAAAVLATEGTPLSDHRASARYRSAMLGQSLLRLYAGQSPEREAQP
ncbi:FAD binding domain-containing protein [Rothia sp. ARF10]|nr:FAD binding domain-containing protein [Rothia sp. ARF10]